jgi:hypothetical protein
VCIPRDGVVYLETEFTYVPRVYSLARALSKMTLETRTFLRT